jgi:hypothetical protein
MRRRTSLAAAAALGAAWALSACGIPTDKAPEVIGDAPTDFDASSGATPETFEPTNLADETVRNFLKAAAGDPVSRDDRLNRFTLSGEEQFSQSSDGIRLVADLQISVKDADDFDSATVTVTGSVVGTYEDDGSVRMNPTPSEYDATFTLQREDIQATWKMSSLPMQVALDYDYFGDAYVQAPMYFQAGQAELLVPELRWIYEQLEAETRQRMLFDWLILGPGESVSVSASTAIPNGTTGKLTPEDGAVRVDLSLGEAIDDDTAKAIAAQIVWSLGIDGEFTLAADGEIRAEGEAADWRGWNAIPQDLPETAYFIANETVWEYTADQRVTMESSDHPWVGFTAPGLRQVAVGPADKIAAVVAGSGGDVLKTGASTSTMRAVSGLGGSLIDPQWLDDDTVLVVDDGVPTLVVPSTGGTQPLGVGDQVTAMALAADARRVAYVEDGLAWVAPLGLDADGNLTVGGPERIGLDIASVTDVAWSSENYLWVAGERDDSQLFRVAIDNSRTEPQEGTGTFPQITQIAANPADPVESILDRGEPVVIVANETLYRVFTGGPNEVRNGDQPVGGTAPFTVL